MDVVRSLRPAGESTADPAAPAAASVRSLASRQGDEALVHAVLRGDRHAAGELYDRHAPRCRRVLMRLLGPDPDLGDLLQDVFTLALRDLEKLADGALVGNWLVGIAVHVARRTIRTRSRWRWLRPTAPEDLPDLPSYDADELVSEQLKSVYAILRTLDADDRIAFALRFIEGMELTEVAAASGCSLATAKRRLRRAEDAFHAAAAKHPALAARLATGRERA